MKHYLPGKISDLDQINPGECIIFGISNEAHIGVVVETPKEGKFILDLDYVDKDGGMQFQIYNGAHFSNEPMISLDKARIVPSLDAGNLGTGVHGRHVVGRALYVTEVGPIVYAGINHTVRKINLTDGSIYSGDISDQFHTTLWRVEVETGTGEFQTLREFKA